MIQEWERKAADGTLSLDDVKAYVELIRAGRNSAFPKASKKLKVDQIVTFKESQGDNESKRKNSR